MCFSCALPLTVQTVLMKSSKRLVGLDSLVGRYKLSLSLPPFFYRNHKWFPEAFHFGAGLPMILVGLKKDLRTDSRTIEELKKASQKPVPIEDVSPFFLF